MAQFTWTFDAPTGTYKQHALSRQLYYASLEKTVYMQHVSTVEGYGKKMGENVTLTRVRTITEPTSAVLTEGVRIPEDTFRLSTRTITVQEIGRSVPFTSFAQDLSFLDLENAIQRRLRDQMRLYLDTLAAVNGFRAAQIKYTPRGTASGNFDTGGTATTQAIANWGVYHCERVRDYLYDTLQAPGVDGDDYIGIFRSQSLRGLKSDPDWEQWHNYTDPQAKFNSEVGKIEQIRHIETNHALANRLQGAGSILGEGYVFGDDAVAMAEVLTPELRGQTNVGQDFGRQNAVAWYGIIAFAPIWDTANAGEAKIVHVTST